jgi:hypothetical protein
MMHCWKMELGKAVELADELLIVADELLIVAEDEKDPNPRAPSAG